MNLLGQDGSLGDSCSVPFLATSLPYSYQYVYTLPRTGNTADNNPATFTYFFRPVTLVHLQST